MTIVAQLHQLPMTIVVHLHQLPVTIMRHLHHPPFSIMGQWIHRNGAILIFSIGRDGRTCTIHAVTHQLRTCGYYSTSASDPSSEPSWCVPMVYRIKQFRTCAYIICRPYERFTGMVRP